MQSDSYKKRHLSKNLPDWFCLKNHKAVSVLDALGWYTQAGVREICYSQLLEMRRPQRSRSRGDWDGCVLQGLTKMRENPICDFSSDPFSQHPFTFWVGFKNSEVPVVRPMTLPDLYNLLELHGRRTLAETSTRLAEFNAGNFMNAGRPFFDSTDGPLDRLASAGCVPLIIDLGFPNQMLKLHFAKHLQKLRNQAKEKPFSARKQSPDLNIWKKAGLLPCMDLLIWAEEKEVRLPDRLIADALGSGNADEESVRKTLRPLAMGLLKPEENRGVLARLRALAYLASFPLKEQK